MKRLVFIYLLSAVSIFASTINIAVAANVSFVIKEIKKEFYKSNPDIQVDVTVGSSGKLASMISHNAPYHIYMSANMDYPNTLYQKGFATTKPKVYAKGALSLISSKQLDFSKGLDLIKDKSIKKIAVANPKTAPYGVATKEALLNAKLYESLKDKFVYGESIAQTVLYATRIADLGFIAKSALFSSKLSHFKEGVNYIDVDLKLYKPIDQGIVMLKHGDKNRDVLSFYDFILSDKAKEIFKNFGYILP